MKHFIFSVVIIFSFSISGYSQSKLGDMACVYVNTTNLGNSAAFYDKLGFPKFASNTFPVPWLQCSDGSLLIMMREDTAAYMGLTYYVNDIDKTVEQLEKDGVVFDAKPKAGDAVKRYFIKSPDGFSIMLVPNIGGFKQPTGITMLNMKPDDFQSADKYPNQQCGVFGEFCHPVADLKISLAFWKKIGFTVKAEMKQPYPHAILSDGLMIIGLHQTKHFNYPAITYFGLNVPQKIQQLQEKGLHDFTEVAGKTNVVFKTFEGQHFFLFSIGQ